MTTLNEAREDIFSKFVEAVPDGFTVALQNEDLATEKLEEWARCSVFNTLFQQNTLGSKGKRRFERRGVMRVNIFVEGGKGTSRLDEVSTLVRDAYEGFTFEITSVTFFDVSVNEIGPSGKWYQYDVVGNFRYYETK